MYYVILVLGEGGSPLSKTVYHGERCDNVQKWLLLCRHDENVRLEGLTGRMKAMYK